MNNNFKLDQSMEAHGFYANNANAIPNIWGHEPLLQTMESHGNRLPGLSGYPAAPQFGIPDTYASGLAQNNIESDEVYAGDASDIPTPPDNMRTKDSQMLAQNSSNPFIFGASALIVLAAFLL